MSSSPRKFCSECGHRFPAHSLVCPERTPIVRRGSDHVPGERSTAEYSELAIAVARATGRLRVDRDGLGWIHDMEPDAAKEPEEK